MRPQVIALPLVATLALAACGTTRIDADKGERIIRSVVSDQIGARVATVTCPQDVDVAKGATFTCAVTGADGSKGAVSVRQTDDEGHVQVSAPFLHVREAEAVMARQISRRIDVSPITIACPEIIVVVKGRLFRCTATAAGKRRPVSARLTDATGHFRYRLS